MARFYRLIVGVLAVWRITHLLHDEDGPGDVFVRLRQRAGRGFWGDVLDCFYCLSVWVAAPLAWVLGEGWRERLALVPALSAGAILIERLMSRERPALPALYVEDEETTDGLLRR